MDAIVVGAGHNGLVAACYLARSGWRVTVCERHEVPGGATVTEELSPGVLVSTASYSLSLLRPDIWRELELGRHGLRIRPKDPQLFAPLAHRALYVWRDRARTLASIETVHEPDVDGYVRWSEFWDAAVAALRPAFEDPDPPTLDELERSLPPEVWRLAVADSAADTVSEFFESDELRGVFGSQGVIGCSAPVSAPGTAWVMSYHALGGELAGMSGTWAYVEGGMGGVTGALLSAAAEGGVEVLTGAEVSRVLVSDGRALGVALVDGTEMTADVVLSGADPVVTFAGLVGVEHLPPDFAERVRGWRTHSPVIKVNLALSELPDFVAAPGTAPGPQHAGTVEVSPSLAYLEDAWRDAADGRVSSRPWMEVFLQSATDPTLVPGGGHVLSAFAQYAPADLTDDHGRITAEGRTKWESTREAAGNAVVDTLAALAPNLRAAITARQVLGPPDLEDRFALTGGNIFHGEMLPSQSFAGRFDARSPIPGLYLCGSGARPGGAVTGAPGRNAALRVLEDP